jgi:serine/threonine-protein kinase
VHEHNIINRDVKPSNILMTEKGQPMLTDFGLVKLFEGRDTHLTASGAGIGTPDYMAPEQWTGDATALSDMYSLGVVLYEMVTGHRPYVSDTPAGVLLKQVNEPLPLPTDYVSDLPKNIESVLLKALARRPEDRYPDMRTFANELQALIEGRDPMAVTIKTETLREHMTGKVKKQEIEEARRQIEKIQQTQSHLPLVESQPVNKRKSNLPLIITVLVLFSLFTICGGCWVLSRIGTLAALPTPTQPVTFSPLPSVVPSKTKMPPTLIPPTETSLPTEVPLPDEIRDERNVLMRLVPGGEFTMGSDDGDPQSHPASLISIDTFYMDKYEVSNEMYSACVSAGVCRKPKIFGSINRQSYYTEPEFATYPVIFADWKMAKTYCEWRDARLPTEAEWEKAARGTDARLFPWGDGFNCSLANHSGCVGDTDSVYKYEKGQSVYGIYGMSGNVWEWTSSLYKIYPYTPKDGREDLNAPGARVARGGSWHYFGAEGSVYTYSRLKLDAGYYGFYVGFRCAKTK